MLFRERRNQEVWKAIEISNATVARLSAKMAELRAELNFLKARIEWVQEPVPMPEPIKPAYSSGGLWGL